MKVLVFILISFFLSISLCQAEADMDKLQKRKWLRIKTKDFDIVTDMDQKEAKILINDLEAYRYFYTNVLGMQLDPQAEALTMLAISSSSSFKSLDLPDSWAGVFRFGEDSIAVANVAKYSDDLKKPSWGRHVMLHEYQHYLSRFALKKIEFPLWFEEGKAEYNATFKYDGKNIYIGNPKAVMFRVYGLYNKLGSMQIDSREVFTTTSLPMKSTRKEDLMAVNKFYSRSFFIVHYLYSSIELRESMAKYFSLIFSGVSEEKAMNQAFHQTFEEFDEKVINYVINQLSMRVLSVKNGDFMFPEVSVDIKELTKDEARGRLTYFVRTLGLE